MDHGASQRAAWLLVLRTEDHAAADNGLQEEATKPRECGDSGKVGPKINETCAGPSWPVQDYRDQTLAAAVWDPWWRRPQSHPAPKVGDSQARRSLGH